MRRLAYPVTPKRSMKPSHSLSRSHSLALCTSQLWPGTVLSTTSRFVNALQQGRGSDTEVTWEDEQNINKFGRLNNRFHELEDEIKITKFILKVGILCGLVQ
ncbi:hypothetical protein HN51_024741, partial [Arachis hypogaea]